MNDHTTYDIYYDEEGDFLEISFDEPASEGTTEEVESGFFVTRDSKTHRITNIGILDFKHRATLLRKILSQVNVRFPLTISV